MICRSLHQKFHPFRTLEVRPFRSQLQNIRADETNEKAYVVCEFRDLAQTEKFVILRAIKRSPAGYMLM